MLFKFLSIYKSAILILYLGWALLLNGKFYHRQLSIVSQLAVYLNQKYSFDIDESAWPIIMRFVKWEA